MLRNVLTCLNGVDTWPCDEINYIWRHGNRSVRTDEFVPELATPSVIQYIRSQFIKQSRASGSVVPGFLLEKTCANSLRVPFVNAVLPEARYIYIVRDGRDVVSSAMRRWTAPLDVNYLAAKARYVPPSDLAYYAFRYALNRFSKIVDRRSALSVWGPRFEGMQEFTPSSRLEDVCAAQWVRCVTLSGEAFADMDASRWHQVRYEDFVSEPASILREIVDFLGHDANMKEIYKACSSVHAESVRSGKGESGATLPLSALEILDGCLKRYHYI